MPQQRTINPGRKKKQKNLRKIEGGYVNQHGVAFTNEEREELIKSVNRSNYRRRKMIEEEAKITPHLGGEPKGASWSQLHTMGEYSDMIITHQSKNLQRFKTKEDYYRFMEKQEKIQSGEYLELRGELYKTNYVNLLKELCGRDADDVARKIKAMSGRQFARLAQKDECFTLEYLYGPEPVATKLNRIRSALDMEEFEDMDYPDEYYDVDEDEDEYY